MHNVVLYDGVLVPVSEKKILSLETVLSSPITLVTIVFSVLKITSQISQLHYLAYFATLSGNFVTLSVSCYIIGKSGVTLSADVTLSSVTGIPIPNLVTKNHMQCMGGGGITV